MDFGRLGHFKAIEEGAVGAIEVFEDPDVAAALETRMLAREKGIIQHNITVRAAPDQGVGIKGKVLPTATPLWPEIVTTN